MIRNSGWFAVFAREMMLYRKKITKKGHIFAALITPLIYLVAFGLGLGRRVQMDSGSYLEYLIPGLVAMSSMTNSYNWLATSLNLSVRYFRTFQVMLQSPITPSAIVTGEIAAGMVKGLVSSSLIIVVGFLLSPHFSLGPVFFLVWILNSFLFASLGVIVAMYAKSHEEAGAFSNLIIMPMTFFSGTFFPLDRAPGSIKAAMYLLPLTHTNIVIRETTLDIRGWISLGAMFAFALLFFFVGERMVRNYSE